MKLRISLIVCFIVFSSDVWAQQKTVFVNQELLSKQTGREQYEAILRGNLAQCRAEATETAERTYSTPRMCSMDMNPGQYVVCEQRRDELRAQKQQMFQDIALGCMAKQGWVLSSQY